jgi:hypothetical protein
MIKLWFMIFGWIVAVLGYAFGMATLCVYLWDYVHPAASIGAAIVLLSAGMATFIAISEWAYWR